MLACDVCGKKLLEVRFDCYACYLVFNTHFCRTCRRVRPTEHMLVRRRGQSYQSSRVIEEV